MDYLENLKNTNNEKLQEIVIDIEQIRRLILNNKIFLHQFNEKGIDTESIVSLIQVLKYRLFIGIMCADFCSSFNIYFNAKAIYEEKFALRCLNVIINEGFKKIYNFQNNNLQGNLIDKRRKNSFWIKEIKPIVEKEFEKFRPKYDGITTKLDRYLENDFEKLKISRDLSIHYDKNPLLIYNMIVDLDLDINLQLITDMMNIIREMFDFTEEISNFLFADFETKFAKMLKN